MLLTHVTFWYRKFINITYLSQPTKTRKKSLIWFHSRTQVKHKRTRFGYELVMNKLGSEEKARVNMHCINIYSPKISHLFSFVTKEKMKSLLLRSISMVIVPSLAQTIMNLSKFDVNFVQKIHTINVSHSCKF